MMSAESNEPKYPVLDDIDVPEKVIENWQVTIDMLAEIAGVPAALIMRVNARDIEVFLSSHSPGNVYHHGEKAPLDTGLYCETVMSTRRKLVVPNSLKDPHWDHNPDIKLGMISYCGVPLTWPNGEIFGTICILDKKENAFTQQSHHLMDRFRDSIQLSIASIYPSSLARHQKEEAESQLRTSETRSQRYLDTTQTMVLALDATGCVTMLNRAGQA
ncbi:MAG: GAF domain-containing protein, partial [Verrucomicrobiota bacterium]